MRAMTVTSVASIHMVGGSSSAATAEASRREEYSMGYMVSCTS